MPRQRRGHISVSIVTNEKPAVWAAKQVSNTECLGKPGTQKCDAHGTALFTEGTAQKGLQVGKIRRNPESSVFKNKRSRRS